jgi:hypothetical protein
MTNHDHQYSTLRQRLADLLTTWPELTHTFSFTAGAIYALEQAGQDALRDRRSYQECEREAHTQVLRDVLSALDSGRKVAKSWVAGFMYNSAIMRIDACYERSLRAITSELRRSKKLAPSPKERGSKTEKAAQRIERSFSPAISLGRVHLELNSIDVNCLKHALFGRVAKNETTRAVGDVENAVGALDELFTILETPEIQQALTSAYKALPPA